MFRILRYSTGAAAALVAVVAGTIWLMDRNASVSFAQVVNNVQQAKSVSFVVKQKLGNQPSPRRPTRRSSDGVRPPNHTSGGDCCGRGRTVMPWR